MRLVLAGVTHRFGARTVLDGVDMTIERGRSVAITGPSGSGKSTLLGICGGDITPSAGTVSVVSAESAPTATSGSCAYVLQTMNLLARRSAVDNVAVGALQTGATWREARARAANLLDQVGLSARAGQAARELSGGEVQRVCIARALASDRPFVLADEPTGQLDRASTRSVITYLLDACTDRGLVIVTHDFEVAARCDVRYEISDGKPVPQ